MPINFKLNNVSVKDHIGKAFLSVVCIEKVHSHGRIRHPPPPSLTHGYYTLHSRTSRFISNCTDSEAAN